MTTGTGGADDEFWRPPPEQPDGPPPEQPAGPPPEQPRPTDAPATRAAPLGYSGPPPTAAPPPGWRPPMVSQPPPPRRLPDQDLDALDARERSARTLTYGIGMIIGAVLVVVTCLLCSRILF